MKIAPSSTRTFVSLRSRLAAACLAPLLLATISVEAQTNPKSSSPTKKDGVIPLHATGPFEVKIDPQPPEEKAGGAAVGRMLLAKQFHGDLEATSKGTMLASGTGAKGSSGGYVALEIVTGALKGQHRYLRPRTQRHDEPRRPPAEHHRDSRLRHRPTHRPCRQDEHQHGRRQTLLRL